MFSAIISLANPIGAESIGGDDIGSCIQIAHRDFFNDLRLRQRHYVIIAFLVFCQTKCASIGSFIQPVRLYLGPECPISQYYALGDLRQQMCPCVPAAASSCVAVRGLRPSNSKIASLSYPPLHPKKV